MPKKLLELDSPKYLRRLAKYLNQKADIYHNGRRLYLMDGDFKVDVGQVADRQVGTLRFVPNAIAKNGMDPITIDPEKLVDGNLRSICVSREQK